ncbi:hypothetical protein IPM19_04490 [bacterium]|nr:MAG: hypothetical protein IPM19_04490 [bacterium]
MLNKFIIAFIAALYVGSAMLVPTKIFAQSNCQADFKLYHPNAPTGSIDLRVDDLSTEVQVHVKVPASSLGFHPCGKNARFTYSWSNNTDNFVLNQGSTEKSVYLRNNLGIGNGNYTIKFQTNNTLGSNDFSSVYQERTVKLKIGKGPQEGGGGGGGTGDDDDGGSGDGNGNDDGSGTGGGGADVDSSVKVIGGDFDAVLGTFSNPLEFDSVPELIIRIINILLMLAAMIAVAVIIWGGFQMVTSSGNETRLTNGKKAVMWAIGGLIVCLMSFSIVAIIERVIAR